MDAGSLEPERDVGKARFQQELNRWFQSRGIIADLRSHLRHLMITALQNNQVGAKLTDGSSPKAQALNLMVAEYLFRRGCHYTLSVFTSEVPTLANFNLDDVLQDAKAAGPGKKRTKPKHRFQATDVEEIFDALGMSSRVEELTLLKSKYLEMGNEASLLELFLPTMVRLATKLQVQQNLHSTAVEGERLLSKEWSSKIVDVLLSERIDPSHVSAVEEAIFRITEKETQRAVEEARISQIQMLSEREIRIQRYLRKHEEEILYQLTKAEKGLMERKEVIEEELGEREAYLAKMAIEWNDKHQEILKLSNKFHNIENEKRNNEKKLKELEEKNKKLKAQEEAQIKTIRDMQEEMNSVMNKLKQITDSNDILREKIQVLMNRESKEQSLDRHSANQVPTRETPEAPLFWTENLTINCDGPATHPNKQELKKFMQNPEQWDEPSKTFPHSGDTEASKRDFSLSDDEDSVSSSIEDIIDQVQKKLQFLEGESEQLNRNFFQLKLKLISVDSDSESLKNLSTESPPSIQQVTPKETKFCQTVENPFLKIQKQVRPEKSEFDGFYPKKPETHTTKFIVREPTKRQLQNREFFLDRRHLLQQLESLQVKNMPADSAADSSVVESSIEESIRSTKKPSAPPNSDEKTNLENKFPAQVKKSLVENTKKPKSDKECLALLEEARIKSPQGRKPLRQQILLSESEKDESERGSPRPTPRVPVGKNSRSDGFW